MLTLILQSDYFVSPFSPKIIFFKFLNHIVKQKLFGPNPCIFYLYNLYMCIKGQK